MVKVLRASPEGDTKEVDGKYRAKAGLMKKSQREGVCSSRKRDEPGRAEVASTLTTSMLLS